MTDAQTPSQIQTAQPKSGRARKLALMAAVPAALVLGVGVYWFAGGSSQSTENANLHQARISVAPTVGGRVVNVAVTELQTVHQGDVLFQVDPEPYRIALAQAEAAVNAARLQVEGLRAAYHQAEGQAELAADNAAYQARELARKETLKDAGVAAETSLNDARHLARQAEETAAVAKLTVAAALAALGNDPAAPTDAHPAVVAALAALDHARYSLDNATVRAPADGVIYQASSFRPGAMLAAGQTVFALVETSDAWVEANFKETQLTDIAVGQTADVVFDMAPNETFTGTVQAIGAGTGAEFSLLPAQNATGNWVKVTQRVPVRIALDDPAAMAHLASGISAEVTVDTGSTPSQQIAALAD